MPVRSIQSAARSGAAGPTWESQRRTEVGNDSSGCSGPFSIAKARSISAFDALSRRSTVDGARVRSAVNNTGSRTEAGGSGACLLLIPIQLGDPDRSGASFSPQRCELENRLCGLQALEPLVSHPLGGELLQSGRRGPGRTPGLGIDGKLKPRAESKCPQDSEIVFGKPLCWIAYRPDQSAFQVLLAAKGISPLVPKRVIGNGIDGEVASSQIVVERDAVLDHCVPAIGGYVPAEGGDLVQYPIAIQHAHGSILDANRHGSGKEALHLLRCG